MSFDAIITDGLSREFHNPRLKNSLPVRALDQLNLCVPAGIIFGFLGPNGSGKTTTIRLLLGLLEPSRGSARVLGFDTRDQASEIRQSCGALLEHVGLYERLSAEDNLQFFGQIWKLSPVERTSRIKELLSNLNLWERRKEPVGSWSRGMKQKLAIARALLHRPRLVFLDEPTASLDPEAAASLRDDLGRLAYQEGVTVFLTTHNLAEAEKLCARVAVIRQGRLLAVGSPDEIRSQSRSNGSAPGGTLEIKGSGFAKSLIEGVGKLSGVQWVELNDGRLSVGLQAGVDSAFIVTYLAANGVLIQEVRRGTASLEEAFLTMMEEDHNAA